MKQEITDLVESYERGGISRRELIGALALMALGARVANSAPAAFQSPFQAPFQAIDVNHVALNVTDIPRSRDFYRNLLGMPVVRESAGSCFLGLQGNVLALFRNQTAGMNHHCLSIKNYEVGPVTEELKRRGLNPRHPSGSSRVYFDDPDGIEVQLSSKDHFA